MCFQIPANVRNVSVTASGSGFALLQLSYKYNINVTGAWPRFTLDPMVDKISSSDYLRLTVCTAFVFFKYYNSKQFLTHTFL